jgi:hypothetical protein
VARDEATKRKLSSHHELVVAFAAPGATVFKVLDTEPGEISAGATEHQGERK